MLRQELSHKLGRWKPNNVESERTETERLESIEAWAAPRKRTEIKALSRVAGLLLTCQFGNHKQQHVQWINDQMDTIDAQIAMTVPIQDLKRSQGIHQYLSMLRLVTTLAAVKAVRQLVCELIVFTVRVRRDLNTLTHLAQFTAKHFEEDNLQQQVEQNRNLNECCADLCWNGENILCIRPTLCTAAPRNYEAREC